MFKIASLAAIGAVASATFLATERNLATFANAPGYNAPCTFSSTTETCNAAQNICCARITKMVNGVVSNFTATQTPFACVPAETNRWVIDIGSNTTLMAQCNFQTTATNAVASLNSTCSLWKNAVSTAASWFGNATEYCDATRSYTFSFNGSSYSNATLDATYRSCI